MPTQPVSLRPSSSFKRLIVRLKRAGIPVIPFFLIVATSVGMTALLITATLSCTYDPVDTQ